MKRSFCYLFFIITISIYIGHNFHFHIIQKHSTENNLSNIANHPYEEHHSVNHDFFVINNTNLFIVKENKSYLVAFELNFGPQLSNSFVWQPPKVF
jgi:hypothetical protein